MAFFFGDSFDLYALPADALLGHWDSTSSLSNPSLVAGRFSNSRAWNFGSSTSGLNKTSNINDTVHHFVLAFMQTSALSGTFLGASIELFDGTTAQCSVVFRSDGAILLTSGAPAGTVLAAYLGAVTTQNVWFAFEIEVVINNTTGSIAVRKNGNTSNDFFLGSLNTRNTANNYANKLSLVLTNSNTTPYVDDFLWRSDASSVPWLGDVRCYTRYPASDVAVQLSRSGGAYSSLLYGTTGITNSYGANAAHYIQFTSNFNGLLTGVSMNCTNGGGGTGHTKAALFSSVGNTIGAILATSDELTNPGATVVTFNFSTPGRIVSGQVYWIGINQDANITCNVLNSSSALLNAISLTLPYASWPTANPGGTITTFNIPGNLTLLITPQFNADAVSEPQQDATASYVYSSTNGQADFYGLGNIITPFVTYGITTRGLFIKSDAGTRNASVQLKSATTTVQGPNTALNTVWGWVSRVDLVDPGTGLPWTAAGVNNLTFGPVITA